MKKLCLYFDGDLPSKKEMIRPFQLILNPDQGKLERLPAEKVNKNKLNLGRIVRNILQKHSQYLWVNWFYIFGAIPLQYL